MLRTRERLIALDVDVDIGLDRAGNLPYAVRSAAVRLGSHARGDAEFFAVLYNLARIGGDNRLRNQLTGRHCLIDAGNHGLTGNFAQRFARQASRG